ncbi:MAG: 1-deoxy-D-xylulose-5-phosphate reductoisomerase [Pseudomonadota bacterium]|nr:1-deoxy-D-xylulose-5-phosphate reductoisomerase [Pseudomonadota bacterium]
MEKIAILGATGSIGSSALNVVERHSERFTISALSGYSRIEALSELALRYNPGIVVVSQGSSRLLKELLGKGAKHSVVLEGQQGLCEMVCDKETDTVIAGIAGAAGLVPTLAAIQAGKKVLIANKEPLVMMGSTIREAARRSGAQILPIDSEHNAVFQCMPQNAQQLCAQGSISDSDVLRDQYGIRRITLTASGGPFLDMPLSALHDVSPAQAAAHPKWSMGRKISIDSATLMNKGLELIEACALFGVSPADVDIVIHPQCLVHSLVEYLDGSILAQMANPDMRTPIAAALGFPDRLTSGTRSLDLAEIGQMTFAKPDEARYPCLALARQAAEAGGTAPVVLNAANEEAVEAYCDGRIRFTEIYPLVDQTMQGLELEQSKDLENILRIDRKARKVAQGLLSGTEPPFSKRVANL